MTGTAAYLRRLGIDRALPPTLDSLVAIHRRHLARVPYENLCIMLGKPPSVDSAACLERVGSVGRAGYCFHQNGALETVLRNLGYEVERRHGHVWTDEGNRYDRELNHLVLVVSGLPNGANPDGHWWADVGLGDGFHDPLPIMTGSHEQGGFTYRIDEVRADGWSFWHDASGSFTGIEVTTAPTDPMAVLAAHAQLSTPPEGPFARMLLVERRDASGVDALRGCVLVRIDPDARTDTDLTSYDAWRGALVDTFRLPLVGIDDDDLAALWTRTWSAHQEWDAAGRP